MDFIRKAKDSVVLKPQSVKIIDTNVVAIPTANGMTQSITLMIIGLGDNNIMYIYEGKDKTWREQT